MITDFLKKQSEKNYNLKYSDHLDFENLGELNIREILKYIFNRDIKSKADFSFREKLIVPLNLTGDEGRNYEELFKHLTTIEIKEKSGKKTEKGAKEERKFDNYRSLRLHWIKFHTKEELKRDDIQIFSYFDSKGIRTYIFDKQERYVIILQPYKDNQYFIITAYYCIYDSMFETLEKKHKRKLPEIH